MFSASRPIIFNCYVLFVVAAARLSAQVTESPHTIKPGKFLVEVDAIKLSFGRADAAGNKYDGLAVAQGVLSVGLTQTIDLQLGVDFFLRERVEFRGARDSRSGLGDLTFRTKWTFWHDDQLGTAALIPHVRMPTGTGGVGSKAVEGGLIIPWATGVGAGITAGAMLHWDLVRNDDDNGYDSRFLVTAFAQRNLTGNLGIYGEAALQAASTGLSDWAGSVGVGATWQLTTSIQLDYEVLRGLNARASDWTHVWRVNWEW